MIILIIYEGFFVLDNLKSSLEKDIIDKHITTQFRPEITHEHLYGKKASFQIIGYGNNGINEGFLVNMISYEDKELKTLFDKIPIPHITLSISNTGRAVDTSKLEFKPINGQIIDTKFGGFNGQKIF
jgi:hypothetical protein